MSFSGLCAICHFSLSWIFKPASFTDISWVSLIKEINVALIFLIQNPVFPLPFLGKFLEVTSNEYLCFSLYVCFSNHEGYTSASVKVTPLNCPAKTTVLIWPGFCMELTTVGPPGPWCSFLVWIVFHDSSLAGLVVSCFWWPLLSLVCGMVILRLPLRC